MTERSESGRSIGSELIDMIIARNEIAVPGVVEHYRTAEKRIAENVGEVALVVVRRQEQYLDRRSRKWAVQGTLVKLHAGRINAPAPVVDPRLRRWAIPTERYLVKVNTKDKVDAKPGPMPVDDFVPKPADPALNSTLELGAYSEAMEYTYGDPNSFVGTTTVRSRLLKQTSLLIGLEEISTSVYGALARQVD